MGNLLCCIKRGPPPDEDLQAKLTHNQQIASVEKSAPEPGQLIQEKKPENQNKQVNENEENKTNLTEKKEITSEHEENKTNTLEKQETKESNLEKQDSTDLRKKAKSIKNWNKKKTEIKETSQIQRHLSKKGEKMINNYCILDTLGEGSFGKVKMCVKSLMGREKKFAAKVFKKSKLRRKKDMIKDKDGKMKYRDALQNVLNEIAIMKKLDHPNVVRLHEVLDDEEKDKIYMILDFAANGQLIEWDDDEGMFFYTNPDNEGFLSEEKLRQIFRQCITGLHYLHVNHIIHRDIKPQNILFDEENRPKLADFGQSELFEKEDKLTSTEGTYWFMSPEMLDASSSNIEGKPTDIWSLGITFYAFAFLKVPFFGTNLLDIIENIKTKELAFPEDREISEELKNLLKKMIDKNPKTRATLEELTKDEWLNKDEEPLEKEIEGIEKIVFEEVKYEDIIIPLERIAFMKSVANVMKKNTLKKSLKEGPERENSLNEAENKE